MLRIHTIFVNFLEVFMVSFVCVANAGRATVDITEDVYVCACGPVKFVTVCTWILRVCVKVNFMEIGRVDILFVQ